MKQTFRFFQVMKTCALGLCLVGASLCVNAKSDIPVMSAEPFDTIVDGRAVALYTITNGTIAAQITNYGGFIVSLYAPDKDGKYANLVTNYSDIHHYLNYNLGMVGPSVGRYANRIANGQFTLNGKQYQVTRNQGQHTLHGGTKGFDHQVWEVVKASGKKLVLKCVLPDGTDGFPGTLTTYLTYSITKDNGLSVEYEATTDAPTVVSMTTHSYFNLNGIGSGDIMTHQLTVNADAITEVDRGGIPSGKLLPVEGTPYDFRNTVTLGDRIVAGRGFGFPFGPRQEIPEGKVAQYDHNFCLTHSKANAVEKVVTLFAPESGRKMEVWNNHPGIQIYTGARTAIALESQMYPDSPNHPEFPSVVLNPGEKYSHTCIYKFVK